MHVDVDHENPLPYKMPAFGLAAVPSPTNNRNTAPGCHPATGEPVAAPDAAPDAPAATGSPEDTCPAGATARHRTPNSRRLAAATVHANGAAPEPSPEPPNANHANTSSLTPRTPPADALITGADATAGDATSISDTPDEPPPSTPNESTSGATKSADVSTKSDSDESDSDESDSDESDSDETDSDRSPEPEFTSAASLTPDTTEPGRG